MRVILALVLSLSVLSAQAPDPSTLPLVQQADLVNVGGFKVPLPAPDGSGHFNYGGQVMAMAPDGQSLYLAGGWKYAQITIPTPILSGNVNALPRASYVKTFVNTLKGRNGSAGPVPADVLAGLLVHGNRMIAAAIVYYDSNNTQLRSHFAQNLDGSGASNWSQVWDAKKSGFVSGPMTPIPAEWQAKLGGSTIASPAAMPIVSRTSFGPAAFVFDPSKVGQGAVPAIPLVYYPGNHPTLGPWNGSNPTYGGTTMIGGVVIVPGTRSMLFFGSNGVGAHCYGDGVTDKAQHNPAREKCHDPLSTAKGSHAYPYKYQVWAYDLNDLAAVKAGQKQPWEVKPYGVWPIDLPITHNREVRLTSVAIDPVTGRIYAAQYKGEIQADGGGQPIIWAFDVKGSAPPPPPPPPPVDPPPPPPPVDPPPPPPPSEVETLKAEIATLQIQLAAERATIVVMHQQLADAEARGDATTLALAAMHAERDVAVKRHADLLAALKALLAQ